MCTAVSLFGKFPMLGRTLDVEEEYDEEIIVSLAKNETGRENSEKHILGIGLVCDGEPLFFDAVNSSGLAGAGLNLPYFTGYGSSASASRAIASHSVIRAVLSSCDSVSDVSEYLADAVITNEAHFSGLEATPMHWIFSDRSASLVVESIGGELAVYMNEWGVLANAPSFDFHNLNIRLFASLCADSVASDTSFIPGVSYSRGIGTVGLLGDFSSPSRFVRAGFLSRVTEPSTSRCGEISRLLHILDNVSIPRGSVITETGKCTESAYTVCYDLSEQILYLKTYGGHSLYAVSLSDYQSSPEITRIPIPREFSPRFITPPGLA